MNFVTLLNGRVFLSMRYKISILSLALATCFCANTFAFAERIENKVAVFTGIDKITGITHTFDVYINETVRFGQLELTPRVCYSRPVTEEPKTTSFLEVNELTLDRRVKRIFTGWMLAESPGLNAIEHPVNDVWLIGCKQTSTEAPPPS